MNVLIFNRPSTNPLKSSFTNEYNTEYNTFTNEYNNLFIFWTKGLTQVVLYYISYIYFLKLNPYRWLVDSQPLCRTEITTQHTICSMQWIWTLRETSGSGDLRNCFRGISISMRKTHWKRSKVTAPSLIEWAISLCWIGLVEESQRVS